MSECKKISKYGGQAVIEGVMMRGPKDFAIAVRKANGEIVSSTESVHTVTGRLSWMAKPFLRGTLALIDSMALGIKALKFSADIAMADATEAECKKANEANPESCTPKEPTKVNDMVVGLTMVLGMAIGLLFFMFVPMLIVKPLKPYLGGGFQMTALEGLIKITFFVGYVMVISLLKDVRRVFQYHGAEHKTINAYEAGEVLTRENVRKYSTVHVRCGTSFMLVVLCISIVVFMFLKWDSIWLRLVYKLALLPLVAGIAYEIIKFAGSRKDWLLTKIILAPGLLMQRVTTHEPDDDMLDVAIESLNKVMEAEKQRDNPPISADSCESSAVSQI